MQNRECLLLVLAAVAAACGVSHTSRRADPSLIVVTLDTLRADRLGAYGSTRELTPNLDRFAREGALVETAVSAAPLTLPAHCSLFTGQYPPAHGVHENADVLRGTSVPTLAELLSRTGFRTGAFVASGVLDPSRGLNRGFDRYDAVTPARDAYGRLRVRRAADQVVARAEAWLDEISGGRFFAWLHFYDAHAPYEAPAPYRRAHAHPYDAAVRFIDAQIGYLLQVLETRGLADRTVVVIVGDHGESLGEHGEWAHGLFVYDSVIRVPLMIRAPVAALRGQRIGGVTRGVDVMPTVLELLGIPYASRIDGQSLLPLLTGAQRDVEAYVENLYPHARFGWSPVRALRSARFKAIDTTRPELYDLHLDPSEQHNLFEEHPDIAARLLTRLRQYGSHDAAPTVAALDSRLRERLGALGYVSVGPAVPPAAAIAPDPKDMVGVFNRLTMPGVARAAANAGAPGSEVRP